MQKHRLSPSIYNLSSWRGDKLYIANTRTRSSAVFERSVGELILSIIDSIVDNNEHLDANSPIVKKLIDAGFIVDSSLDELEFVKDKYFSEVSRSDILPLVIAPTMGCNMSCFYCYEKKYTASNLDAQKILDTILPSMPIGGQVSVQWHGGEPLLALPMIEMVTDALHAAARERQSTYSAGMTTNGSMLSSDVVARLQACHVSQLQITLDGARLNHDKTRKIKGFSGSSFDQVLSGIRACSGRIRVSLRVNIWKRNIDGIKELLQMLSLDDARHALGIVYFAPVFNNSNQDSAAKRGNYNPKPDVHFNVESYASLEEELVEYAFQLGLPVSGDMLKKSFATCVAVRERGLVIEANGELKRCYHDLGDSDAAFAHVGTGIQITREHNIEKWDAFRPWDDPYCRSCELMPVCLGGCPHKRFEATDRREVCPSMKYNWRRTLPHLIGEDVEK